MVVARVVRETPLVAEEVDAEAEVFRRIVVGLGQAVALDLAISGGTLHAGLFPPHDVRGAPADGEDMQQLRRREALDGIPRMHDEGERRELRLARDRAVRDADGVGGSLHLRAVRGIEIAREFHADGRERGLAEDEGVLRRHEVARNIAEFRAGMRARVERALDTGCLEIVAQQLGHEGLVAGRIRRVEADEALEELRDLGDGLCHLRRPSTTR